MLKQILFSAALLVLAIQCKILREQSKQQVPTIQDPQILYDLINEQRTRMNVANPLRTGLLTDNVLFGMAQQEVSSMLENHSFGQHLNFEANSNSFSAYTEIICKLRNDYGNVYKSAFEFWLENEEISEQLKENYSYADAYCMPYENHWLCALMLADN